jgi:hypothetical protein
VSRAKGSTPTEPWKTTRVSVTQNGSANTMSCLSRSIDEGGGLERARKIVSQISRTKKMPNRVGICDVRLRPHRDQHSAEIGGIERGWVSQSKKRRPTCVPSFLKRERNYAGQNLWTRGDFVDSVGRNTEVIRRYIQKQEAEDKRMDKMEFPHIYNLVNEPLKEDIK